MEEELKRDHQADLRMCFDYISQVRNLEHSKHKHNVTLLVIVLGAISWILFFSTPLNMLFQEFLLLFFTLVIVLILYVNLIIAKTESYCQTLQAMILNGKISSSQEFIEAFDMTIPKSQGKITEWVKSATNMVDNSRPKKE
jgi:hypothetical protein